MSSVSEAALTTIQVTMAMVVITQTMAILVLGFCCNMLYKIAKRGG